MQRVGHNWVTELNWWHWIYTLKKVVFVSIKRLAHEYLWQCSLQSFKTEKTQVSINIMINKFMHWNATLKWKKDKLLILTWYGWISLTMLNDRSHTYRCCIYGMTLLTLKFKSIENWSVVEVGIVATPREDTDRGSKQGTFWDDGNVLCIGSNSGYNSYIHMQKLSRS